MACIVLFVGLFFFTILVDLRVRQLLPVSLSSSVSKMVLWMLALWVICLFIVSLFSFLSWMDDGQGVQQLREYACTYTDGTFWPIIVILAEVAVLLPFLGFYLFLICHRNSFSMRREWEEHKDAAD